MNLSILCVTKAEPHAIPFLTAMGRLAQFSDSEFLIGADGDEAMETLTPLIARTIPRVRVLDRICLNGYVNESVHAVAEQCEGDYVLCLDDDERCSEGLIDWILGQQYREHPMWRIPRAWLWDSPQTFIKSKPHWPDYQFRLGKRGYFTIPTEIHGGWMQSPLKKQFCPYAIEHHKLLIRSREEREATVRQYDGIKRGAGFPRFYLPDDLPKTVAPWQS